ncbi:hypothetical protein F8388_020421 [Cannabis sativa]|uniref:DUF1995 domain-containing protein n=1 Tax=Cannabis sativa TaxID=3483 RepID=A0A7J6HLN7_CANSA|nr:hypothetical protein F8388_020421 [Cannabis sativa]KAF4395895.1 hypothetical protein G4B88_028065 [Cannabis sativa]
MASNLLKIQLHTTPTPNTKFESQLANAFSSLSSFRVHHHCHLSSSTASVFHNHKNSSPWIKVPIRSSLPSSSPPTSKESAILQAKTCLSSTLEKPLNNTKLTNKLKRVKQPRFRVEIPVIDDSPESLSRLSFEVFGEIPFKRKGSPVNILIIWPNDSYKEAALRVFESYPSCPVDHVDFSSLTTGGLSSADVAVFLAPEVKDLGNVKSVSDDFYPRPVVVFNPRWAFEEESEFGELSSFVGSFEVVYSFMGLEVKGILSKRRGVIFKCVRDGVVSGEKWSVLVEEEDGELRVISKFKARPSIGEVENVLYNLMAVNSPVTKSVKFLKDLVSNVTGKK